MFVKFVIIAALFFGAVLARDDAKKNLRSPVESQEKSHDNHDDDKCLKLTDAEVVALWNNWNNNFFTRDAAIIANQYWPESILVPLVSDVPRLDFASKYEYYVGVLENQKPPYATLITTYIVSDTCNIAQFSGLFDIQALTGIVHARYTFIFEYYKPTKEWKIRTHHASLQPAPTATSAVKHYYANTMTAADYEALKGF